MNIADPELGDELKANSKNIFPPPRLAWLKGDDGLSLFYEEFPTLMRRGEVYWANIVRANELLF